ncbi:MAG: hypothetical protein M1814_004883 [Vezdaea aestivalis]|nr:MAG: hypothetical protein M1814_004883 [Vezdaea aestivalis]
MSHPAFLPENGAPGLSIYYFCHIVCKCNIDDSKEQMLFHLDDVEGLKDVFMELKDGIVNVRRVSNGPLPPNLPSALTPDACDGFSQPACQALANYKPLKSYPKSAKPSQDSIAAKRCGNRCIGPEQCGDNCMCVVQSAPSQGSYSSWNSWAIALCMSPAIASSRADGLKRNGKRDLKFMAADIDIMCPCNSTLASKACCEMEFASNVDTRALIESDFKNV